jgi:hypothetical protein
MTKEQIDLTIVQQWKEEGRWFRVNCMAVFDSVVVGEKTMLRKRDLNVYTIAPSLETSGQIAQWYDETQFTGEALIFLQSLVIPAIQLHPLPRSNSGI